MKVVSDNTEADIARHHAEGRLGAALRELTANLLRVVRGAGRPALVGVQCADVLKALQAYNEATGVWPSGDLVANALEPEEPHYLNQLKGRELERHYAERAILRGALQMVASDLLGQLTQERAGEHQLYDGLNRIQDIREADRREFLAAQRASRPARKTPAKRKRTKKT